jgi:hypothetical protein
MNMISTRVALCVLLSAFAVVAAQAATAPQAGSQSSGEPARGQTHDCKAPRDAASGLASGKRMHKPLTINKETDAATPATVAGCSNGSHDEDRAAGAPLKGIDVKLGKSQ